MFCKNCGANIPDNAKFCKECGNPIVAEPENTPAAPEAAPEAPVVEAPAAEEVPTAGETTVPSPEDAPAAPEAPEAPEAEKAPEALTIKKKSKAKPIIITVAIIVAVLGILAGLLIGLRDTYREWGGPFPYIANTVDKMFLSDKDYGKKVAENAIEGGMEDLKDKINEVTNNESEGESEKKQINLQDLGVTAKTKIEVDAALLDILEQAVGMDLSFLKSVEIVADVDSASNAFKIALDAKLNDKSVAKLSAIADYENTKAIYLTLPELSESALKVAIPEEEMAQAKAEMEELMKQMEAIDIDAATNLIIKVLEVAMEQIDENDYATEDEKLTVEGVTVNATKVSVKIDAKVIRKVAVSVLEELESSADLETLVGNIAEMQGMSKDDIYPEIKESLGQMVDQIKNADVEEMDLDFDLNINLWVDGKQDIIGMGADFEMEGQKMDLRAVSAVDGKDEALEVVAKMDMDGQKIEAGLAGKGTREDGKLSGDYAVKYNDTDIVEFKLENCSEAGGSVTIKLAKGAKELLGKWVPEETVKYLSDAAIKITTESTDTTSKMAIEIIYANANLVKLSTELTLRDLDKNFKVEADKTFDVENEEDMMQFAQTIDLEKLMSNLEEAGLPLDELMGMMTDLGDLNFGGAEESVAEKNPGYDYDGDYNENIDYEDLMASAAA